MTDLNIIAEALVDVRKAHRLIYTFNHRVFEMIESIDDNLSEFTFEKIEPVNDGLMKNWVPGKPNIDFWEATPFIQTLACWSKQAEPDIVSIGDLLFGFVVNVDSEWLENDDEVDPSTYSVSASNSKTEIHFYLLCMKLEMTKANMLKVWDNFETEVDMRMTKAKGGKAIGISKKIDMAIINSKSDLIDQTKMFISAASTFI